MYQTECKPLPTGRCYWFQGKSRFYQPEDWIWFYSSRCPRSPRGRLRNRRNPQGRDSDPRLCRWHFATEYCRSGSSAGWPVGRGPDDRYWRGPTAAAASIAESPEGDAEDSEPRVPVPRLSPPRLEDRKRDSLSWSVDNNLPDLTISRSILISFLYFLAFLYFVSVALVSSHFLAVCILSLFSIFFSYHQFSLAFLCVTDTAFSFARSRNQRNSRSSTRDHWWSRSPSSCVECELMRHVCILVQS